MQYVLVSTDEGSNITVFVPGKAPLVAHSTHPNFEAIVQGTISGDEKVIDLFDVAKSADEKFRHLTARVSTKNGRLFFDGEEVDDSLAESVVRFLKDGVDDWKPLVALFENLQDNPSEDSRKQLYEWVKASKLTITPDGLIVGYKGVQKRDGKFFSINTGFALVNGEGMNGSIPNEPGSIIEMPRDQVTFDPSVSCAQGLHVGTFSYARGFSRHAVLEVHVNPRDVVSVPSDHNGEKMRVCRYRVIGTVDKQHEAPVLVEEKPVEANPLPVEESKEILDAVKEQIAAKKAKTTAAGTVAVDDVFEDTDSRRKGRTFKVTDFEGDHAVGISKGILGERKRKIHVDRLLSRKYKKVS